MPPEGELFSLREAERRRMKEERARERKLEVHEKSTYSSRLCSNTALIRKQVMEAIDAPGEGDTAAGSRENIHDDSEFVLATTKDKHVENEDLAGYVARKREMFLLQYSLGVKKDEIKKLEGIAQVCVCVCMCMCVYMCVCVCVCVCVYVCSYVYLHVY